MSDRIQIFGVKLELSSNKTRSNRTLLNRMTKMIIPSILVANVFFAWCCGYATHLIVGNRVKRVPNHQCSPWIPMKGPQNGWTVYTERTIWAPNSRKSKNLQYLKQYRTEKIVLKALVRQNPNQKIKSEVIKNGPGVIIWNWIQISWAGTQSFFLAQFMLWLFSMFS